MPGCSRAVACSFTPPSPARSSNPSRTSPRPSPKPWHIISPRRGCSTRQRVIGCALAKSPSRAMPILKRSPICAAASRLSAASLTAQARTGSSSTSSSRWDPVLLAAEGPRSAATAATVTRARELCEQLGSAPEYPHVIQWSAIMHAQRGELPEALDGCTAAVGLAEAAGDRPAAVSAMRAAGSVLMVMGRLAEARRTLERSINGLDVSDEAGGLATRAAGRDASVASMAMMGWTLWLLGYPDMGRAVAGAALQRAEAIGRPHTQAYAAYYASVLHALCCEPIVARTHAERCLALSEEHNFGHWGNLSRAVRGICANQLDPSADSLAAVSSELAEFVGSVYQFAITALYALLSQAFLAKHQ